MKITISGKPGAGKSLQKTLLSDQLRCKSYSMGDMKGELAYSKGLTIDEFINTYPPEEVHGKVDKYQTEIGKKEDNFVMDGWMSWYFIPDALKIYLDVEWDTASKRIFFDERNKDEPKYNNLEECKKIIKERYQKTRKQTMLQYSGADLDNFDNFDIVLDTTHRTPEEVLRIIKEKIIDFNQKMYPPKFYLAHPTESRKAIRKWEEGFEERTGIHLINPFFEGENLETQFGNFGKDKYNRLKEQVTELYAGDLEQISRKDVLGGIVFLDDNWTWGTPAEQATMWLMSKLIYTLTLSKESNYYNHPVVRFYSGNKVFNSAEKLEKFLVNNKPFFFRDLEEIRRETPKNLIYQKIMAQIDKNKSFNAFKQS